MNLFEMENVGEALDFLEVHWQFRSARALMTAHQLGIFQALREPAAAHEVASKCRTDERMTEKLLIACCALEMVRRADSEKYVLTQLGRDLMLPDSVRYIGGVLDHGETLWWAWSGLPENIRTGKWSPSAKPPDEFIEKWHEHWIWAMHGNAVNGVAQWLASEVDLTGRISLLDVGGGPGTHSIALCQKYPGLKAVVWDLEPTLAIARENIKRFDLAGRISLKEGDWNSDEFGSGYDCLLMANVLHGPGSHAEMKLEKAKKALVPGGLLIILDFLLNNDRTGPLPAALFNLMIGAYSPNELLEVVRSAGFLEASLMALHRRGSGIITAVSPRS